LWEVERHTVQVGDWAPGLGLAQRAGVSDLEAERNIEFTALGIERVVATVVGGQARAPLAGRESRARARNGAARGQRPWAGAGRLTRSPRTGRYASRSAPRPRRLRSTGQRGPTKR